MKKFFSKRILWSLSRFLLYGFLFAFLVSKSSLHSLDVFESWFRDLEPMIVAAFSCLVFLVSFVVEDIWDFVVWFWRRYAKTDKSGN